MIFVDSLQERFTLPVENILISVMPILLQLTNTRAIYVSRINEIEEKNFQYVTRTIVCSACRLITC